MTESKNPQGPVITSVIITCLAACAGYALHLALTTPTHRAKDGLLVDFDPSLGVPFRDVNDAIALHYIHKSKTGPKLQTLTTTFGNSALGGATSNARALGRRYNLPVFKGLKPLVKGSIERNQTAPAVEALTAHRGAVLGLGSMRNIAAALSNGAIWHQLVIMGGSAQDGPNIRYLSSKELNFAIDPASANTVLQLAPISVTTMPVLLPMDVCRRVGMVFNNDDLKLLPSWLGWRSFPWLMTVKWFAWKKGFVPWDVIAAMVMVRPDLFKMERRGVSMLEQPGPFSSGYITYQQKGFWNVVVDFDANAVRNAFRETVSGRGSSGILSLK